MSIDCQHWNGFCPYQGRCGFMERCNNCHAGNQDRCKRHTDPVYAFKRWCEENRVIGPIISFVVSRIS